MKLVFTHEPLDNNGIFLCGPTPRSTYINSWRPHAVKLFEKYDFNGSLFIPEDGSIINHNREEQIEWEEEGLTRAKCIMFWIPRNLHVMPGFTSNIEFGFWAKSGKVVLGAPLDAKNMNYIRYYATKYNIPQSVHLDHTVELAISMFNERP